MTLTELRKLQTATEFEEQWQSFLLDGFPGWLPQAFSVATQYQKVDARQVLNWMIAEFVSPTHLRRKDMTDEEIQTGLMGIAKLMGTKFVE